MQQVTKCQDMAVSQGDLGPLPTVGQRRHRCKGMIPPSLRSPRPYHFTSWPGWASLFWVRIRQMTIGNPKKADHPSLRMHRRQLWTQILLPVLLASVLLCGIVAVASVSAFRGHGAVGRWAAISTIWLVIPSMLAGLVVFGALATMVYLVWRLVRLIPSYSLRAQRLLHRVETTTKRGAEMVRRPTSAVRALATFVRGRLDRKPERT